MQDVEGITKQKRSIDTEEISSAVPSEKIIEMNENPGEFDNNAAWMSNFFKTKAIQPQNNETEANSGVIYSYTNKRTFQHSKKFLARQALKLKMMEEQTRKQMMEKEKKEREVQLKLLEIVKRNPVPIPKTKEDRKKAREIAKLERTKEKEKLLMERKAIREQERQKLKKMREERDRIKKKFQHQRQMRRKRYLRLKRERRYKQNAKLRKKVPPINTLCYEYYAKNKTDTPKDYAVPEFVWNAALKTFQRNKIHGMTEKRAFATNCVGSKINVSMLLTPTNLVKSMLLSYERRDWKTLYSIMLYALDEKMLYLEQQVMCVSILNINFEILILSYEISLFPVFLFGYTTGSSCLAK